ncbi:GFA family protein [Exilibacterium tricleocarpae]|uniref:GFA family protein n=1 Tax=Exilibacterium tricleocarpae TaxID=2591008 RepID=A0A545TLG8_9GAMM|nr:GFA family protein [Exilibacterium tricleocarpae]TQV78060.1 GFA family protein [Exilibacterium tricleocarpae]
MKIREETISGGCQCGAVRYHSEKIFDNAHICHCRMCQKAVGNLFAALVAAPNDALQWTRGSPDVFQSSDQGERGFCSLCGTPLFYRGKNSGRTNLTIGSLDNPQRVEPHRQEGVESRIPWFSRLTAITDEAATGADGDGEWARSITATNRQHPDHDTDGWP